MDKTHVLASLFIYKAHLPTLLVAFKRLLFFLKACGEVKTTNVFRFHKVAKRHPAIPSLSSYLTVLRALFSLLTGCGYGRSQRASVHKCIHACFRLKTPLQWDLILELHRDIKSAVQYYIHHKPGCHKRHADIGRGLLLSASGLCFSLGACDWLLK